MSTKEDRDKLRDALEENKRLQVQAEGLFELHDEYHESWQHLRDALRAAMTFIAELEDGRPGPSDENWHNLNAVLAEQIETPPAVCRWKWVDGQYQTECGDTSPGVHIDRVCARCLGNIEVVEPPIVVTRRDSKTTTDAWTVPLSTAPWR